MCMSSFVSDSLQPRGLQLTRLLCPWDSPGKNTGVGCRVLSPGDVPDSGIQVSCISFIGRQIFHHWAAIVPTLAWKIPWAEEPGRLQSMGSQSHTKLSNETIFWQDTIQPIKKFFLINYFHMNSHLKVYFLVTHPVHLILITVSVTTLLATRKR